MTEKRILVVDDDTRLRNLLGKYLGDSGFLVELAKDTAQAREFLAAGEFDLVIVDVMMPQENGIEFTKKLRQESLVPVLILTARGEPDDRIRGLEVGADDYMPKPFEPKELLLRINNILRRRDFSSLTQKVSQNLAENVNFGSFCFNFEQMSLKNDEKFIHLTDSEKKIMAILCKNKGELFSREKLAQLCGNIDERSVDVLVTRLRRKVEANPKQPEFLQTVRNEGYVLRG